MKNVLVIIFSFICLAASAQKVESGMLKDGRTWIIKKWLSGKSEKYTVEGDSAVFGNLAYKKVYHTNQTGKKSFCFLSLEENKELFKIDYSQDQATPLLDFNLREGDRAFLWSNDKVLKVDTISVKGRIYRRLIIGSEGTTDLYSENNTYWVDGIGTNNNFFRGVFIYATDGGSYMESCYDGDECIFEYADFYTKNIVSGIAVMKEDSEKEFADGDDKTMYNLAGQRIAQPEDGQVYIQGNKKYLNTK